jgi:hypothetical protein
MHESAWHEAAVEGRAEHLLCPGTSDVNLFCYCQRVIYFDAQVSDCAFDLGMAGLLAQLKSDGPPCFLLSNRCAIRRVAAGGDILDPDSNDVTAAKLAVDCQIEHREVANSAFDLELCPDRPDMFRSQWRLCPGQLAFVPGHALVGYRGSVHFSCIIILLGQRHRGARDRRLRH